MNYITVVPDVALMWREIESVELESLSGIFEYYNYRAELILRHVSKGPLDFLSLLKWTSKYVTEFLTAILESDIAVHLFTCKRLRLIHKD